MATSGDAKEVISEQLKESPFSKESILVGIIVVMGIALVKQYFWPATAASDGLAPSTSSAPKETQTPSATPSKSSASKSPPSSHGSSSNSEQNNVFKIVDSSVKTGNISMTASGGGGGSTSSAGQRKNRSSKTNVIEAKNSNADIGAVTMKYKG